jgi:hypothetical protein
MKQVMALACGALLAGAVVAFAGQEKIAYPANYRSGVLYAMSDRPDNKTVRDLYASAETLRAVREGQPLPSGTVLSMEVYRATMAPNGEPVKGADGRFVKDGLVGVFVMEKRTGWGTEYAADLRNGEWEYARFAVTGERQVVDTKPCFECHQPQASEDYLFTFKQLLAAARK